MLWALLYIGLGADARAVVPRHEALDHCLRTSP